MEFYSVIVTSKKDPAGRMIRKWLEEKTIKEYGNISILSETPLIGLYEIEKELLYIEPKDLPFKSEFIVFGSRHASKKEIPALLAHPTGNWGEAIYGGKPERISVAAPWAMKAAIKYFAKIKLQGYEYGYEVTHHGPLLDVPHAFIEVGSTPTQWEDPTATRVAAEACYIAAKSSKKCKIAIGIGGTHYAPRFTSVALVNEDICFGHMLPRYGYPSNPDRLYFLIKQALERSGGEVKMIVLDSKKDAKKLKTFADKLSVPVVRAGDLL